MLNFTQSSDPTQTAQDMGRYYAAVARETFAVAVANPLWTQRDAIDCAFGTVAPDAYITDAEFVREYEQTEATRVDIECVKALLPLLVKGSDA